MLLFVSGSFAGGNEGGLNSWQQAVATLHRQEGKEHVMLGWSIEEIKNWFEGKGFRPVVIEEGGETILCVDVC